MPPPIAPEDDPMFLQILSYLSKSSEKECYPFKIAQAVGREQAYVYKKMKYEWGMGKDNKGNNPYFFSLKEESKVKNKTVFKINWPKIVGLFLDYVYGIIQRNIQIATEMKMDSAARYDPVLINEYIFSNEDKEQFLKRYIKYKIPEGLDRDLKSMYNRKEITENIFIHQLLKEFVSQIGVLKLHTLNELFAVFFSGFKGEIIFGFQDWVWSKQEDPPDDGELLESSRKLLIEINSKIKKEGMTLRTREAQAFNAFINTISQIHDPTEQIVIYSFLKSFKSALQ